MAEFGSFGTAIGGADPIRAALSRRRLGDSVSPLSQVSPGAPSFRGTFGAAPPPSQPAPSSRPVTPKAAPGGGPITTTEAELIIKALVERLRNISKSETQAGPSSPTPTSPISQILAGGVSRLQL